MVKEETAETAELSILTVQAQFLELEQLVHLNFKLNQERLQNLREAPLLLHREQEEEVVCLAGARERLGEAEAEAAVMLVILYFLHLHQVALEQLL
jgi:hypothetical protein